MKKIVSSLLVTVGSLGILAGIAGAVYALGRNGSKIREWITGESSESSSKTERPPASSESGSSSSGPTSSSSSELPAVVPYNDPSKPLGITVGIEPFEYYHETGASPITVPIDVYTTGWESGGEATITYEIVGMGGQAASGISISKEGIDPITGFTGTLPGGGHYVMTMSQAAYDTFYVYQFKATIQLGEERHVSQAKFCTNGAVSNSPYQGNLTNGALTIASRSGGTEGKSVQPDNDTSNVTSYYVVSSFADSTKLVRVQVDAWEEGDTVLLETDDFGSNASELTVPVGTEIRFRFPKKNQGEADRYRVRMSFAGEPEIWTQHISNYGVSLADPVMIHPEGNVEYDPSVDGANVRVKTLLPVRSDEVNVLKSARVEFDNSIKDVMTASINQYDRTSSVSKDSYLRYAEIDYCASDQWVNVHLGHIDPGVSGNVTIRCLGRDWTFTYYREAEQPLLWFSPETVLMKNGNATSKSYHVYFPEGKRDSGLCEMALRNVATAGSTVSGDITLGGTSSNGERISVAHGGTVSIAYPSFGEGDYKRYELLYYYDGELIRTEPCAAGRTISNPNWETILGVNGQTVATNNGYFERDIAIYFSHSTEGKTAWLQIYMEDHPEVQFTVSSDHYAAYNSTGNSWQNQVTPVPETSGNVHVTMYSALEEGTYTIRFKHYYSDHPNLDGAFCTFNKAITLTVA